MPAPPLLDADLVARRVHVRARDTVFVKGIVEASEGLAVLFAERGGELTLAAPRARQIELDEMIADLVQDVGAVVDPADPEA